MRNENGSGSSSPGCSSSAIVVDRAAIEPRRRAGLESRQPKAEPRERAADAARRSFAGPAAGRLRFAGVHERLQERAGREHDGPRTVDGIAADANTDDARIESAIESIVLTRLDLVFRQQILDHFLPQREIRLLLDEPLDLGLIRLLIGLRPRAVHRRALAAIEHAKLNAGGVDRPAHRAAERIDLADDLPLADAADRRVAAHLPDGVAIGREQRRLRPNRAAASAASVPACPAPTTITSNSYWLLIP